MRRSPHGSILMNLNVNFLILTLRTRPILRGWELIGTVRMSRRERQRQHQPMGVSNVSMFDVAGEVAHVLHEK